MSILAHLRRPGVLIPAVVLSALVVLAGFYAMVRLSPDRSETQGAESALPGDADETRPKADIQADAQTTAQPDVPAAPRMDLFRLAPDGSALIAGSAAPGWQVEILLDDTPLATVLTGNDGKFAQFITLPDSDLPRVLTLWMRGKDGGAPILSDDQLIVAPRLSAAQSSVTVAPEPAPTVLKSDATGVHVLQAPEPDALPRAQPAVALDAISYGEDGAVQLSGWGIGAGLVRIYLDNSLIGTVPVDAAGRWQSRLPAVATGLYTLRIDALDGAGAVISRAETPFRREDHAQLAEMQASAAAAAQGDAPNVLENRPQGESEAQAPLARPVARVVTVQPGNTLWAISREAYGEGILYMRVVNANAARISDPDLIYPGQVFTLPE